MGPGYDGKMPKEKITLGTEAFRVARNDELFIVHREGSNAPIDEMTQRRVAFVLENMNRRTVSKVRACNGTNSILQRPKDGWNEGSDWDSLLPLDLRKKDPKQHHSHPNGQFATARAFSSPPGTVRRSGQFPRRQFQTAIRSNVPPTDTIRTFVGPRAMG